MIEDKGKPYLNKKSRWLITRKWLPWISAFFVFIVYLRTFAPTVDFVDCGELATSATLLWIPHPTGYPLFLLIGHLFTKLPFGAEAIIRLNVMSAICCALGVGVFAYFLKFLLDFSSGRILLGLNVRVFQKEVPDKKRLHGSQKVADGRKYRGKHSAPIRSSLKGSSKGRASPYDTHSLSEAILWILACFGALILGFSRSYWISANSAEVYPLYILLFSLNLYLFTRFITEADPRREKLLGRLWSFVLGISFTNHLSVVLLAPAFLVAFFWRYRTQQAVLSRLAFLAPPFFLGLLPLLLLPIRALSEPPMNWIFPLDFSTLWTHLTGARYHSWMLNLDTALPKNFPAFWVNLPSQFGYVAFFLAAIGFVYLLLRNRLVFIFTFLLFLSCFAYAVTYNISEIEPFFLQCYFMISAWALLGTYAVVFWLRQKNAWAILTTLMIISLTTSVSLNFSEADRSSNYMPADFIANLLSDAKPGAVIFSSDYNRISSVYMYFHYVRGLRPDVTLIEVALLSERWYLRTLEKYHSSVYSEEMKKLFESLITRERVFTAEEYKRRQIQLIIDKVYEKHPVYFESTVEHNLVPSGYQIIPVGLLYRLYCVGEPLPFPSSPTDYIFRDIFFVDYNADKIRNIYMTMLYANGIRAERLNIPQLALQYYDYAASFFPPLPELVSSHREGYYLKNRKRDVDQSREYLRAKLGGT